MGEAVISMDMAHTCEAFDGRNWAAVWPITEDPADSESEWLGHFESQDMFEHPILIGIPLLDYFNPHYIG